MNRHGDLNNTHGARTAVDLAVDSTYSHLSFAIEVHEDDPVDRDRYRPFLLSERFAAEDWVAQLELNAALRMMKSEILDPGCDRLRILVLEGIRNLAKQSTKLRVCLLISRSYSCLLAYEAARILFRLGCDVRVYDPADLPQKDDVRYSHPEVQELRELTSVRPTQGRTLAVAEVSGGSQSFNAVNSLRILGRWMRMFTIPNQSSVPKAYTQFTPETEGSRMIPSSNRDRLVDCMEELVKYTIIMRPHFDLFGDRFSERYERRQKEMKPEETVPLHTATNLAS
ncbi:hypothetical protein DL769_003122 [Monosporascus sp. CRB-8-3]|nr:hypothetical protein DL769_003122 [Monosporascus sp. CRB-8-3]